MNEEKVISILCKAFDDNPAVNYAINGRSERRERMRNLIRYSLHIAKYGGEILLNENETCAALITYSNKKIIFIRQWLFDARLVLNSIGISGIRKNQFRKKYIRSHHPKTAYIYLWFIGTEESEQRKGHASRMITKIVDLSNRLKMPVYLETSAPENLPFYKQNGFEIYHEEMIPFSNFTTYFIRRENER